MGGSLKGAALGVEGAAGPLGVLELSKQTAEPADNVLGWEAKGCHGDWLRCHCRAQQTVAWVFLTLWNRPDLPGERLPGREKPADFQALLLAKASNWGAAAGTAETRVFVALLSGKGGNAGGQQCEKSVPGSEWVLGNGKSEGSKPPAGKHSADRGREVHTLKYTAPRGPASEGSKLAGLRAPWFSVQTASAGEIKIGAESRRSPPVCGLQLGREGRRPVGLARGSRAGKGGAAPEVQHEFSPDKVRVSASQLAEPASGNQ